MSDSLPFVFRWRQAIAESELPSTVRHVAHVLSLHMNGAGGSCWPGVQLLTDETSYSDRCVQRALATLYAKGWVRRTERRGKPSVYEATIPRGRTSFGGDSLSPLERVGGDTGSPPPPNVSPPGGDSRSPEVLQEEAIKEETAAEQPPPAHARDGGGEDLEPEPFTEAVALLGLTDSQRDLARRSFDEDEHGFLRVVQEARLSGRAPAALLMSKLSRGEHRGKGGRLNMTPADIHELADELPPGAPPPSPLPEGWLRNPPLGECFGCGKETALVDAIRCADCARPDEEAALAETADLVAEGVLEAR